MCEENSVSNQGDNLVQVEEQLKKEIINDGTEKIIISIYPLFKKSELSTEGISIATNSMINEESVVGCPVCQNLRPCKMFSKTIGNFVICKICDESCPRCEEQSLENVDEGLGCYNCDFILCHQ
jgi:rubrerythrin